MRSANRGPSGIDQDVSAARRSTLAGAWAGRGFRYQDAVAANLAVLGLIERRTWVVRPEGGDDITIAEGSSVLELQARSHRGRSREVTISEFTEWLVELWTRHADEANNPEVRFGLVVDRPIVGVEETGLLATLGEVAAEALTTRLETRDLPAATSLGDLLARSHLIVIPEPVRAGTGLLRNHLNIADAAAELVFRQVQAWVGELADARGLPGEPIAELTSNELSRLLDDTVGVIDYDKLESVVRDGLCEHVDFVSAAHDPYFYLGVDATPAHVAAGLVLDRPEDVEAILNALETEGVALVTGPSGSGKTSLAWLSAHASRHAIRWLRLRTAAPRDVPALIRFIQAWRPTPGTPVGLVVDDIGRTGASLWDLLAREFRHVPGALLLGTIRDEDVELVETAPSHLIFRPRLSVDLAESLWRELHTREQTRATGWREAFEASDGLLLEYVHILTTGQRLQETIDAQVARRRREGRDLELRILRVAGLTAALGGTTDTALLRSVLGAHDEDLQRALARLLDEHLLCEDREGLRGLHRLRSESIVRAAHRLPPPPLVETARVSLATVRVDDLPDVVVGMTQQAILDVEEVGTEIRARLEKSPTPDTLIVCLDSLRLAGVHLRAQSFTRVMQEEGVPAAQQSLTVTMAAIRSEPLDLFPPQMKAALTRLHTIEDYDPRTGWLETLTPTLVDAAVEAARTTDEAIRVLAAFQGAHVPSVASSLSKLAAEHAGGCDLQDLADLIAGARGVSLQLAQDFVEAAGGVEQHLQRGRRELPWVTTLDLAECEDGLEIRCTWLYVGSELQDDPHQQVVDLCQLLAGLFPEADFMAVVAIDPSGAPAGFGDFALADKRIPRNNLPNSATVRWNRALARVCAYEAAGPTKTERLEVESALLRRTVELTRELANRWARGQTVGSDHQQNLQEIVIDSLKVARTEAIPDDPLVVATHIPDVGDIASLCHMICGNALPRLFSDPQWALAAFLGETVARDIEALTGIGYWRLLEQAHDDSLEELASVVRDTHAVVCARLSAPVPSSRMRRAARSATPLSAAARIAREEAAERLQASIETVERSVDAQGYRSRCIRRPPEKRNGVCWPPDAVAVIVDVESLFDFFIDAHLFVGQTATAFGDLREMMIVPRRNGLLVPHMAINGRFLQRQVVPTRHDAQAWLEHSGNAFAELHASPELDRLCNAVVIASALERISVARSLIGPEQTTLADARRNIDQSVTRLNDLVEEDSTAVLQEVLLPLFEIMRGEDFDVKLAKLVHGNDDEAHGVLALIRLALAEWDINADASRAIIDTGIERFQELLAGQTP